MTYDKAHKIATYWLKRLQPYCDRIEIAGSIRREKPEVKDIELVCIPKTIPVDSLFKDDNRTMRHPGFAQELQDQEVLTVIKGNAHTGRYTQVHLDEYNIKIDVFIASVDNYGHLLAIRTGPAEYSHKVLAHGWVKAGYHSVEGMLTRNDKPISIKEEEDLFKLIGIPYVEPTKRLAP